MRGVSHISKMMPSANCFSCFRAAGLLTRCCADRQGLQIWALSSHLGASAYCLKINLADFRDVMVSALVAAC